MPACREEALGLQLLVVGPSEAPGSFSPPRGAQRADCSFSLGVRNL